MAILIRKLLRDVWLALTLVCLLLAAFQCLWFKVTQRICGDLVPLITGLSRRGGVDAAAVQNVLFQGPGKILRTLMGGERIQLDNAMDMLSIGYVHPLMQTIFCIWAIGRAAGAIAGELDRGTMELLLAQPIPRYRLVLAHLCVDAVTIPILCLSLWAGNWLGTWLMGPIEVQPLPEMPSKPAYLVELGPFKIRLEDPRPMMPPSGPETADRLAVRPSAFGPALFLVGGLLFAVSGATMGLSAAGRFRWRVLGLAVLIALVQFLINLIGQMWDAMEPLRPLTIFYYYQPQQVILGQQWNVSLSEWNGGQLLIPVPMPLVLYGVGLLGYGLALWTFNRRDLPAPL
ncbi:MAG TPA: ABC transporter permease subunit [Gemmataceae bacterium]|nr:ABC transporter permease subunit [Gemmataceae bacterium]